MQASRRAFLGFMAVATAGVLSGCSTFRPVYGGQEMGLAFNVEGPSTPIERIAYREFVSRFENSAAPDVPKFEYSVSISGGPGGFVANTGAPGAPTRGQTIRSTIVASVVWNGEAVFSVERFADAGYSSGRGTIADLATAEEAAERATKAAAESVRIAVLAEYPKHEQMWSRTKR